MPLAINTKAQPAPRTTSNSFKDQVAHPDQSRVMGNGEDSPGPLSRPPISPISPSATAVTLPDPPPVDLNQPVSEPQPAKGAALPKQLPQSSQPQADAQVPPVVQPPAQTEFIDPPAPVAIVPDDDTDSAALRAAISILQIQKEKSRRDIKTLQKLKNGLIEDPDAFTEELLSGRLREEKLPNDPLQATFAGNEENADSDERDTERSELEAPRETSSDSAGRADGTSSYPKIPAAQNVIRCPPINWAKYHIAGEPLDRMHEEQRTKPTPSEPSRDPSQQSAQQYPFTFKATPRAGEHQVYAPYDPHLDKSATVTEQMGVGAQTRKIAKKPEFSGGSGYG